MINENISKLYDLKLSTYVIYNPLPYSSRNDTEHSHNHKHPKWQKNYVYIVT